MKYEEIINKLKIEQNKTADWVEYFNRKMDLIETKLSRIEETIEEMKEHDELMAKHILRFHEKFNTEK